MKVPRTSTVLLIITIMLTKSSDNQVDREEMCVIYKQIIGYLKRFAKENNVLVIVTENGESEDRFLHNLLVKKADTVVRINKSKYEKEFVLEKHPSYVLGTANYDSEVTTLNSFM